MAAPPADAPPPAARPRRPRTLRRRLVGCAGFALIALVLVAVGLEVDARLFFESPFGAEGELVGMYENTPDGSTVQTVPGFEGTFTVEGRTVPVQLNRLGLRSPEIGPRQPGQSRVLCLGDSFVFGYGVAGDEAFPAVLAGLLSERTGHDVVTGNAGVPGYGTVEDARCLRRIGAAFDPDVVVMTIYIGNDFVDDRVEQHCVIGGISLSGRWAALMQKSARARAMLHSRAWMRLEMWLMEKGSRWSLRPVRSADAERGFAGFPNHFEPNQCFAGLFMDCIDPQRSWDDAHPLPVVPRVLATTSQSLTAIRDAAGSARVLVAIMPTWWHLQPADRAEVMTRVGLDPADYRLGLVQQRLVELCGNLGLPVVDLTPSFLALPEPTSAFLQENRHLNPAGHRLVAEALAPRIAELLP